jgi:hypothetical protein
LPDALAGHTFDEMFKPEEGYGFHDDEFGEPTSGIMPILGVCPWLALASLAVSALFTRAALGSWPTAYVDNPRGPLVDLATGISILSLLCAAVATPLAIVGLVVRSFTRVRSIVDRWSVSAVVGGLTFYAVVQADPFGYLSWLLD